MAGLNVGSAFATFTIKTDGVDSALKKVDSSISSLEKSTKSFSSNFNSGLSKINSRVDDFGKNLEAKAGAIAGITAVGTVGFLGLSSSIKKSVDSASDLNESMNAVNVIFGKASEKILNFGKISAKEVGLANAEFNQLSIGIGSLLKNAGVPMDELAEKTIFLTKRASDMASVNNTSVAEALSAIEQGLRGETEAMRRYASDVTDASIEQYALSKGIKVSVKDMTYQEKSLLRMEKIISDTDVTSGDFKNTIGEVANQQRVMQAEITNSSAKLGTIFLPAVKEIQAFLLPLITKIGEWVQLHPKLTAFIVVLGGVLTGLIVVIGGLALAIAGLTTVATAFQISILPLILIIGAIVVAIGLLIGAGYLLYKSWKNNWFGIRDITDKVFLEIKNLYNNYLVPFFDNLKRILVENKDKFLFIWEMMKGILKRFFDYMVMVAEIGWSIFGGIFKVAMDLMSGNWSKAWEDYKLIFVNIFNAISDYFYKSLNAMINLLNTFIKKINETTGSNIQIFENFSKSANSVTQSTSKLGDEVAKTSVETKKFNTDLTLLGGGLDKTSEKFDNFSKKLRDLLQDQKKAIREVKNDMEDLKKSYNNVENEKKAELSTNIAQVIFDKETELAKLKEELNSADTEDKKIELQKQILAIESFLQKHKEDILANQNAINEIKRVAGLDEIQRLKEEYEIEKEQRKIEYQDKLAELKTHLEEVKNEYKQKLQDLKEEIIKAGLDYLKVKVDVEANYKGISSEENKGKLKGGNKKKGKSAHYDVGTNRVPMDGFAYLHKGETIIPANKQGNPFKENSIFDEIKKTISSFSNLFKIDFPTINNIAEDLSLALENKVDLVSDASDKVSSNINITNNNQMNSPIDYNIFSQKMAFQVANSR